MRLLTGAGWSNPVKFFVGDLPELIEAEPNDSPDQAQRVALPATLNGRIERKGDMDRFAFTAVASEQLVFEVKAEELGSPLDEIGRASCRERGGGCREVGTVDYK